MLSRAEESMQEKLVSNSYDAHEPAVLVLDEQGTVLDCSKVGENLFGCRRNELMWKHVSSLFPQLSEFALIQNGRLNPSLVYLSHCGQHFQAHCNQRGTIECKLYFVHLGNEEKRSIRLLVRPVLNMEGGY